MPGRGNSVNKGKKLRDQLAKENEAACAIGKELIKKLRDLLAKQNEAACVIGRQSSKQR